MSQKKPKLSRKAYPKLLQSLQQLPEAEFIPTMRDLCRTDLWFLLRYVLKRKDLEDVANPDWLFERVREVEEEPDGYIDLWAREHYKSTIITFAKTIQDILRYYGTDHLPEYDEPTFCILANTRPLAKAFLRQIREELEGNDELKELFPDILYADPKKESPQWSLDEGIVVKRKSNPKEATVEASGLVDGQPTGKHFTFLIYDDVVTVETVTNPDMIDKTTDSFRLSDNLGAGETTKKRIIGTRYAHGDTYNVILTSGIAKPRVYACTNDGTPEGPPVMRSREFIAAKYRTQGPYVFSAQMLQNPTADTSQGFKREWFRYYEREYDAKHDTYRSLNRYLMVDPASAKKKNSDYTAAAVIGLGADLNYYLLDFHRDRLNLKERTELVMHLHSTWRPKKTGYEKYGKDSDIEYIKEVQKADNYRFDIKELGGTVAKTDRIKRLIPICADNRFFLPEELYRTLYDGKEVDVVKILIEEEFLIFPVPLHDDGMDCISRIFDLDTVWPRSNVSPLYSEDRWVRAANKRKVGTFMSA